MQFQFYHQNVQVLRAGMSTSMSEEHFSNPQSFEPERWLRHHPRYWQLGLSSHFITLDFSSTPVWILITGTTQRIHLRTYHLVTGPGWLSHTCQNKDQTGKFSKQQYKNVHPGLAWARGLQSWNSTSWQPRWVASCENRLGSILIAEPNMKLIMWSIIMSNIVNGFHSSKNYLPRTFNLRWSKDSKWSIWVRKR